MVSLSDFDYTLPDDRIAQFPSEPRDSSKLLVVDRQTGLIKDQHFYDLLNLLTANDVLVLNNTKVFPARLFVTKGKKQIELLLEREVALTQNSVTFSTLTKPGLKAGDLITVPGTTCSGQVLSIEGYTRIVEFNVNREQLFVILDKHAHTPIPPYIEWNQDDEMALRNKYQTVFAKHQGAVAAPTAGLHFTQDLIEKLKAKGVQIEYVTLHVGLGTFLPVKSEDISQHHMHSEYFELDQDTVDRLNAAKSRGQKITAVGTTTIRVLESSVKENKLESGSGSTDIFIYPPYKFKFVDHLITNFHTPKSTLLMLVSAFASSPNTNHVFTDFSQSLIGDTYEHALVNEYRFYSFGDAMLIL